MFLMGQLSMARVAVGKARESAVLLGREHLAIDLSQLELYLSEQAQSIVCGKPKRRQRPGVGPVQHQKPEVGRAGAAGYCPEDPAGQSGEDLPF
jgi:hypothetical protein